MAEVHRLTGGSDEFINLIRQIEKRVGFLETRPTGSIYMNEQLITTDPATGVDTIFGALPDGSSGLQQWVNDTTPPDQPSTPTVKGGSTLFEITWDGLDVNGAPAPLDYDRTVVEMSTDPSLGIWSEVNHLKAAGRVVVGEQPTKVLRHFRLVSIDANGNRSVPSNVVSDQLIPYMESPEMTTYISGVEADIATVDQKAVAAQNDATTAQTTADTARNEAQAVLDGLVDSAPYGDLELSGLEKYNSSVALKSDKTLSRSGAVFAEGVVSTTLNRTMLLPDIPVTPGRLYRVSFWMWISADVTGNAGMPNMWAKAGGVTYNAEWPPIYWRSHRTNQVVGSWFKVEGDVTAPADVTHMRPRFYIWKDTAVAGTIIRFDDFSVLDITDAKAAMDKALKAENDAATAAYDAQLAAEKAGNAQTTADGKSTAWYQDTKPAGTLHRKGDIWFDTANNNKPMVWDNVLLDWVSARDGEIAVVDNRVDTVVTTVNGKNTNTTSTNVAPTTYSGSTGDIWWQKDTAAPYAIIKQSTWDNTAKAWTEQQVGSTVIANLDAGKISSGTIDAGRIAVGSLTADKIVVGTTGNLLPDPYFKNSTAKSAWMNPERIGAQGTGKTLGGSYLIEAGTTQRGGYFGISNPNFRIPVLEGGKYRIGAWVNTSAIAPTNTLAIYARAYSSTDTAKGFKFTDPLNVINTSDVAATTWTELSGIVTIPAGFDQLVIGLYAQSTYTGSARYSDLYVQQAAGNVLIADNSVTASKMVANTITADSGIIGSLDAGKITVGEMNGARVKAGSIQADRLVVGQGENFIVDSNFPAPVASPPNSTQSRFDRASAGISWVSPNRVGWNATVADATTRVIRLGNQIDNAGWATIPVIPGRNYVVSWQVYSDAVSTTVGTRAAIAWVKEDGTSTYVAGSPATFTPISAVGVNSEIINEFTAPADAVKMRVDLQTNGHHGGGRLDFMRPVARLMTDGTVITKDAVTAKNIVADSITGAKLNVSSVGSRLVTAGALQTHADPLRGVKISDSGIQLYDVNGNSTVSLNALDGSASFRGNITVGSTVPSSTVSGTFTEDKIDGLPQKTASFENTSVKVTNWSDPSHTTLINGGRISTKSITADKIKLGSGANPIPYGDGSAPAEGWQTIRRGDTTGNAIPAGSKGFYTLDNATGALGYSPIFSVSALGTYSFSYYHRSLTTPLLTTRVTIQFFKEPGGVNLMAEKLVSDKTPAAQDTWYQISHTGQMAPAGAASARLRIEILNYSGTYSYQFTNFYLSSGSQTELTDSGLASYKAGVQTVRLNGEDNLLIGELFTGRPGDQPYIKVSSRSSVGAIDFYGLAGGVAQHGAVFWNAEVPGENNHSKLRMYAYEDTYDATTGVWTSTPKSGIELVGSGLARHHGRLAPGQMLKSGVLKYPGGLGAKDSTTLQHFVVDQSITFQDSGVASNNFPSGIVPQILLTATATNSAEVVCTVKNVTNTGFTFGMTNFAPRGTGDLWLNYLAIAGVTNNRY